MRLIAQSRDELERAISLDPFMHEGYAAAFLGYLYSVMPSWPLSFGDKEQGKALIEDAMLINAENVPNNYFYATYLAVVEDYASAEQRLSMAEAALISEALLPKQKELFSKNIRRLSIDIAELKNKK